VYADTRPEFAKHPAVRWQIYQTRPPSKSEIDGWFITGNYTGIAIVTGNISRLVVLDFDSPDLYTDFCATYPHLAKSYTVNTRRGKHIYYSLIPSLQVPPTIHGDGIDLQSEGAYVIAPPTTIQGFTYTVDLDIPLHRLIPADIAIIQAYVRQKKASISPKSKTIASPPPAHAMSIDQLERIYLESLTMGRNNALFWVSCLARDYGISQTSFANQLVNTHASQPTPNHHHHETFISRQREARATIASAYSHPPRPIKPHNRLAPQLPNRLREIMLQHKLMGVLRTIEALRIAGIAPHTQFTATQAIEHTKGIIGRDTIRTALNTQSPITGTHLFQTPRAPRVPNGIAIDHDLLVTNSCELVTVKKSGINAKGRPSVVYTMPSNDDLFAYFDQKPVKQSDTLTPDDLKSVRKTRMTLHQKFLTRLPGRWSVQSFANRLGLTTRTIRNYHKNDQNFRGVALHNSAPVRWGSISDQFDAEFPHKGFFLTDSDHKKYPAKAGIAKVLLAKRQHVVLHERIPNFWWYGSADVPPISAKYNADVRRIVDDIHRQKFAHTRFMTFDSPSVDKTPSAVPDVTAPILNVSFTPPAYLPACDVKTHHAVHQLPLLKGLPIKSPAQPSATPAPMRLNPNILARNTYRRAFEDESQEALTIRLQNAINTRTTDKSDKITRESARRLVAKYSASAIEDAIRLLNTRQNVKKPVGFISTVLRGHKS